MKAETAATGTVIPPPPMVTLPVTGSDLLFPVHRVYCVGRNYAAHAVEMGGDPNQEPPFFFQKNPDNLSLSGRFPYPPGSRDVQFEVELVVALKAGGADISVDEALDLVFGYAVGIDMTRRDLQARAKELQRPWEVAKAFEASAPCSALAPAEAIGHPASGAIWLDVNGTRRQTGDLNQMIWKTSEIIAHLSGLFTLRPGDVIFTGTPSGVGAIVEGDVMRAHIDGVAEIEVRVA